MARDDEGDRLERGRRLAELHMGEGTVDRWRSVSPDLEEMTSAFAFADLWGRPGLSRRDRSIVAMAITATLRAHTQLGWHVRGALGAGVTPDEVREVLIAVSGLAGFPAAWSALETAEPILAEAEAAPGA
ncbi:carboxymuconolactone decarboxylase family protein [Miltoncostaea marina]|uniref:carboxymuconolactone decarboxylase family protein n=1 Tax=Miltoncostaea marina TaxID=2843215 RepID=UPI001C3E8632|nr:carboxymuconolactone decarboxylase family protein [Miltoncostaea marina]